MSAKKPLPKIARCPGCGSVHAHLMRSFDEAFGFHVECSCGFRGPMKQAQRFAIKYWNRRAKDAERMSWEQWSLLAGAWMRPRLGTATTSNFLQAMARERGEVLHAKASKDVTP